MYQKFLSAGNAIVNSTKKSLIAITELKNKAASYLDEVWGRVRVYLSDVRVPGVKFIKITSQELIARELLKTDLRGLIFLVEELDLTGNVVAKKTIELSKTWSEKVGSQKIYYPNNIKDYRLRFGTNLNATSLGSGNVFTGKSYLKIEKNNGLACFLINEEIIPSSISSVERFTKSHFIIKEIWRR